MSKWLDKDKFKDFKNDRQNEAEKPETQMAFARRWRNPVMGSQSKPKEYHLRFLSDPNGEFYKKYNYHMFKSGENWKFIMCPKTHGMDEYCPWCQITQLLYQGSAADKKKAGEYKRKEKYVGNIFVGKDARDADENDDEKKVEGKTFLYEFPSTVEKQVKKELIDEENGWGMDIFDPEKGYNMILRIGAKKPDANGKVWPEYDQTTFAKRATSIADSNEEIEEIMKSCQSVDEFLTNSMWSADKHEETLKSEMVWEDVESDFLKKLGTSKKVETKESSKELKEQEAKESVNETKSGKSSDPTDDELLEELNSL